MRLLRPAAMSAAALASVASQPAAAHAFGQRYDLPLPLGYFLVGGAAVVLLSFVVAAVVLRPSSDRAWQWPLPRLPQRARAIVEGALAAIGLYLFLLILAAGWFGIQEPTENIAPVLVWVLWWVGFLLATGRVAGIAELGMTGWTWVAVTGLLLAGYVGTWMAALRRAPATEVTSILVLGALITAGLTALSKGALPEPVTGTGYLLALAGVAALIAVRGTRVTAPATA